MNSHPIETHCIALLLTAATAVIASADEKAQLSGELHVVLLADEKDHGPAGNGAALLSVAAEALDAAIWRKKSLG